MRTPPAASIDAYLSEVPEDARAALERLRKIIKATVPEAQELISYRIPSFKCNGMLVGFAAFPEHCSFFVMSTRVMRDYAATLDGYDTAKSCIRFTPSQPLPAALVKKLVKARLAENAARKKKR